MLADVQTARASIGVVQNVNDVVQLRYGERRFGASLRHGYHVENHNAFQKAQFVQHGILVQKSTNERADAVHVPHDHLVYFVVVPTFVYNGMMRSAGALLYKFLEIVCSAEWNSRAVSKQVTRA